MGVYVIVRGSYGVGWGEGRKKLTNFINLIVIAFNHPTNKYKLI